MRRRLCAEFAQPQHWQWLCQNFPSPACGFVPPGLAVTAISPHDQVSVADLPHLCVSSRGTTTVPYSQQRQAAFLHGTRHFSLRSADAGRWNTGLYRDRRGCGKRRRRMRHRGAQAQVDKRQGTDRRWEPHSYKHLASGPLKKCQCGAAENCLQGERGGTKTQYVIHRKGTTHSKSGCPQSCRPIKKEKGLNVCLQTHKKIPQVHPGVRKKEPSTRMLNSTQWRTPDIDNPLKHPHTSTLTGEKPPAVALRGAEEGQA